MSLREAFLASPSLTPGSDAARKMTVTSGLQCSAALTKCGPIGSFVRTLLESSRWWSRARLLQWQVRPLYSTRTTTFVDTNSERPLPCNASATTSAVTDTKSSRFLFRLAVLEPPTEGTGCSSSDTELLPTPVVVDNPHPNSKVNESGRRFNQKAESSHSMGLADRAHHNILPQPSQIKYDPRVHGMLLPTPLAVEREHPERVQALKDAGATNFHSRPDKGSDAHPNGIIDFMQFHDMLPTPEASMWKDQTITESTARMGDLHQLRLPRFIAQRMRDNGDFAAPDGGTFRLSPLFTEEMMGFPFLWTTLPFLSPSGAPKPSKPTATPSSPK